jgi:HSP20 family molecular chaperone IbpA
MAFFRPFVSAQEPNLSGLFRLIDDFDRYSAAQTGGHCRQQIKSFTPKFDLRETETAFELHGELAGVQKENVHIEFVDPQTLVVRGRVERTHTAGTPPAAAAAAPALVENEKTPEDTTDSGEDGVLVDHHSDTASVNSYKATVEDDPEETANSTASTKATPASTVAEVAKPAEKQQKPAAPRHKYYIVERNIGQFSRAFTFPGRVDSESVSASLDNGILTITVQKAKRHESRRISVN